MSQWLFRTVSLARQTQRHHAALSTLLPPLKHPLHHTPSPNCCPAHSAHSFPTPTSVIPTANGVGAVASGNSALKFSAREWSTRPSGNKELDSKVLSRNRKWAADIEREKPGFLAALQAQQRPEYLWIGCADSRVPANVVVGMDPGELFVHRNVANLVVQTDMNCLSVLQYAVDALKVKHILVVGHYGCGGVRAALENGNNGLVDNWLRHIQSIARFQARELKRFNDDPTGAVNKLCELNVIRQTLNVGQTTILQDAWRRGQSVAVHGLIYGLNDGLLHDLRVTISSSSEVNMFEDLYARRAYDPAFALADTPTTLAHSKPSFQ